MFKTKSRLYNSLLNAVTGVGGHFISTVVSFAVRTVFILTLGKSYLGINGLFSNIIAVLALSELGIGTAINYNLYKVIAEDNRKKIIDYMRAYKILYRIIALVVFILGICIIPFIDFFIKEKPNIPENLIFIYLLFLANTCLSYLYTYKCSFVIADQKLSIVNLVHLIVMLSLSAVQIVLLLVFKNFILYLIIQIVISLGTNIIVSRIADRMYPFLKKKGEPLTKTEKADLFKNVRALMIYRVCDTVTGSTNNIFISKFFGIIYVGLYSNYYMLISTIRTIVSKILDSVIASVGNLNATASREKTEEVFNLYWFITFWIYCSTSVCLLCLIQPFITLWIGNDFLLDAFTMASIVLLYFITGMMVPVSNYRAAMGLFRQGQLRPALMAVGSIVFMLLLIKPLGIAGIFVGTIAARLLIQSWFDPWVIYKYGFKLPVNKYYVNYIKYFVIFCLTAMFTYWLCAITPLAGISGFIIDMLICAVVPNILLIVLFFKTTEYKKTLDIVLSLIRRLKRKTRTAK